MEFWLERGVDGFRVDTVNMYSKGDMADAPVTDPESEWQFAGFQYCNGPRMGEFLGEMNEVLQKYDAMTVGECPHTPDMARVVKYVSAKERQLNMVFQFVSHYVLLCAFCVATRHVWSHNSKLTFENRTSLISAKARTSSKPPPRTTPSPNSSAQSLKHNPSSASPQTRGQPSSSRTTTNPALSPASLPTPPSTASQAANSSPS